MSLSTLIGGVSGELGLRFNLLGIVPSVILFLFLFILISLWTETPTSAPDVSIAIKKIETISAQQAIFIFIAILLLALIFQPLQLSLVRLFEGYWGNSVVGKKIGNLGKRVQWERREKLKTTVEDENVVYRYYPKKDEGLLPTSLGNVLRAAEDNVGRKYNLTAVIIWPRLYALLPDGIKNILDDERNQLDIAIRLSAVLMLCAIASVIFYFIIIHTSISNDFSSNANIYATIYNYFPISLSGPIYNYFPINVTVYVILLVKYAWWLVIPSITLFFSWLSYKAAISAALSYGKSIEVAFDLYRFELIKTLRLPLPTNYKDEKVFNQDLTQFFLTNYYMGLPYEHPDNPKLNDSVSAISKNVTTDKDVAIEITLANAGRGPADTSNLSVVDFPSHGVLTKGSTPNNIKYIPNSEYTGSDVFTYVTKDGVTSSKVTVNIAINVPPLSPAPAAGKPPIVNDLKAKITSNASIQIPLLSSNPDPKDTLTFSIVTGPTKGMIDHTDHNTVKYTKKEYIQYSTDSFTYKATNNYGLDSNIAKVTIRISTPEPLKRYMILVVGLILIASGVIIAAVWWTEYSINSSSLKMILNGNVIEPDGSIKGIIPVYNTSSSIFLVAYSHWQNETGNEVRADAVLRTTLEDPNREIIQSHEFTNQFFTTFEANVAGNYTFTIFNPTSRSINIDSLFGYLASTYKDGQTYRNPVSEMVTAIIIIIFGIITVAIGVIIMLEHICKQIPDIIINC